MGRAKLCSHVASLLHDPIRMGFAVYRSTKDGAFAVQKHQKWGLRGTVGGIQCQHIKDGAAASLSSQGGRTGNYAFILTGS